MLNGTVRSVDLDFRLPNWPTPLERESVALLEVVGQGLMDVTAYDTAWAARLDQIEPEIASQARQWLRENQLADGSWGSAANIYHHDRVICTLAAVTSLAQERLPADEPLIQCGLFSLRHHVQLLADDAAGETIAFEFLVPTFLTELERLGLNTAKIADVLHGYDAARQRKLERIPGNTIDRRVTMAFSAEMAGTDNHHILNIDDLTEVNGSVALSPSATAYYLLQHNKSDSAARAYLRGSFHDGGMPNVMPFDVFERAWVLWNLSLAGPMPAAVRQAALPHIKFIHRTWQPRYGIGHSSPYTPRDGDDTAFVFELLSRFDRPVDIEALFHYEADGHFRCFAHESNPSVSTNVHMLAALLEAGLSPSDPAVRKVIRFLQARQVDGYWTDKWHASPYYPTAHMVIAAAAQLPELVVETNHWLHKTQHRSGGWGYYGETAEETAYALQALFTLQKHGFAVSQETLLAGAKWLLLDQNKMYPALWIGKCLYAPIHVIEATIMSALLLANQYLPEIRGWLTLKDLAPKPTA